MSHVLEVKDRQYLDYQVHDKNTKNIILMPSGFNPSDLKLFDGDVFEGVDDIKLVSSPIREKTISGVLILEGNKAYGRIGKKLLYRCIPNNKHLPILLVPYMLKDIGFSKRIYNKYVVVRIAKWKDKHPEATLVEVIGNVNESVNFYEYSICCSGLDISYSSFTSYIRRMLKQSTHDKIINDMKCIYNLENRETWEVYSIDPKDTTDIDDAFSLSCLSNGGYLISIYIANVPLWLDILNAWEHITKRISTVYLPHRKHSMLPGLLSNELCSLHENKIRPVIALDLTFDINGDLITHEFKSTTVSVTKNYMYEDPELQHNTSYNKALTLMNELNKKNKWLEHVDGPHTFIESLMVTMNCLCAEHLKSMSTGIFRTYRTSNVKLELSTVPTDVCQFVSRWKNAGGNYTINIHDTCHDAFGVNAYVHVTSPIRRIVDLLNISILQQQLSLTTFNSNTYYSFCDYWMCFSNINCINKTMREIRKIQNNCNILSTSEKDPLFFDKIYKGIVLDCEKTQNELIRYTVYLYEIRNVQQISQSDALDIYSHHNFRLFKFYDESLMREKIRCALHVD